MDDRTLRHVSGKSSPESGVFGKSEEHALRILKEPPSLLQSYCGALNVFFPVPARFSASRPDGDGMDRLNQASDSFGSATMEFRPDAISSHTFA
jgi:hypothetical protein